MTDRATPLREDLSTPATSSVTRGRILETVRDALAPRPWAKAMWEGGAAAWGRLDAWSDIDIVVAVDPEREDEGLRVVEEALAALSPIELRYELPQPTWHGHSQAFFRLRDASPYLVVDLVVMSTAAEHRFMAPERHGQLVVHFDKADIVEQTPSDAAALRERLTGRLATLRTTFPLFQTLVGKELARGHDIEALSFYHAFTLRPLIEVLRIRHAPHRHDFNTRYAHDDLPPPVPDGLREFFFVGSPDELASKHEAAEAWFWREMNGLESDGVSL